jgi:putative acyl-CoA dehydrogenase
MRQAVVQAMHHCSHRRAFGAKLVDQPLMANVLADLALEAEAATWLGMRLALALDRAAENESEALLLRIGTAIGKYWNCKRVPGHAYEAMECTGGSGVMETTMMPRLYREAPVNAIWEGSGNVQCLDVLRAIERTPAALEALIADIAEAAGSNRLLDQRLRDMREVTPNPDDLPFTARSRVENLALAWQASLLIRHAPPEIADAFCATRLGPGTGHLYGALPSGTDWRPILRRAWPEGGAGA